METEVITRTTQEVFNHHMDAFLRRDLKDLASDFTAESIFIASPGIQVVGAEAIANVYKGFYESLDEGTTFSNKQVIIEQDIIFLEWRAESKYNRIDDGVDTFVIRNGNIYAQTANFNMTPVAS